MEALWIKRQIDALAAHCHNELYHIQVREGRYRFRKIRISDFEQSYILQFPTKIWFLKELLTTLILWYVLIFKIKKNGVFAYNFHIAYPLLTYSRILTFFIRKPIFVTEHWSAYHFNFGVKKELKRIQRIFRNKKLRFICVSKALAEDIMRFAKTEIKYEVLYNVVDENVFFYEGNARPRNTFFMLSYWKEPKNPFLILDVFKQIKEEGKNLFQLRIGGFGPMLKKMEDYIQENNLTNECILLGKLNADEIRAEMNSSSFFIHNSDYETFSVVCAEALMCGTPVIASNVGGIKEFLTMELGCLVKENNINGWMTEITTILNSNNTIIHSDISERSKKLFSSNMLGLSYEKIISNNNE
jgi:glycosyltransferase involved in cell wall biosynthesis